MSRQFSYDDVQDLSEKRAVKGVTWPIEVRRVEGPVRQEMGRYEKTYQYFVVDRETREVLYQTPEAHPSAETPSNVETAALAKGFARGCQSAREDG